MTLPNKILTRLTSLGEGILSVIDLKILNHNNSNSAHSDIRNNYVKNADNYKHSHGYINQNGEITQTTSNPSKVLVTEGDKIKAINVLPANKVTHQSLDGKVDKNQGSNNKGKFLKVQDSGEIEPESVTIPSININQIKKSGAEIATINGITLYCNDTSYSVATESTDGLLGSGDKIKLNSIQNGAKPVTFARELNSGVKIGTLTIGNDSTEIFCASQTGSFDNATQSKAGLMSSADKIKLDSIDSDTKKVTFSRVINEGTKIASIKIGQNTTDIFTPNTTALSNKDGLMSSSDKEKLDGIKNGANKVTFSRSINSGTKIASITIDDTNTTDIFSPDYTATNGIQVQNKQISHTNSVAPKTASSLYKIKYDAQGHITDGAKVEIDSTNGGTSGSSNLITSGAVYSALQNKKDVPSLSSTVIKDVQQAGEVRLLKYDKLVICDIVMHGWNVTEANANKTQSLTNAIPEAYRPSSQYTKHIRTSSVDPTKGTLKQQEFYLDVENVKTKYQIIFKCRVSGETNVRVQLMWFTD